MSITSEVSGLVDECAAIAVSWLQMCLTIMNSGSGSTTAMRTNRRQSVVGEVTPEPAWTRATHRTLELL